MLEFSERPWGTYQVLHSTPIAQVKEITVKAGARLSYQTHQKRAEHWFITAGPAIVTIDGVTFIEVQTGTYFGEDDIVRLEDDFGRN